MDTLNFRIIPHTIPLGKTSKAELVVSNTGQQTLENITGRLKVPASLRLLGLANINISKITAGKDVSIPIHLAGDQPGKIQIRLTDLCATNRGGVVLDFNERNLEIEISSDFEPSQRDVSLVLEPVSQIVQNQTGLVRCRLHNNSRFPIKLIELKASAEQCDFDLDKASTFANPIDPGSTLVLSAQALPRLAGNISLLFELRFKELEKSILKEERHTITVQPSTQPPPTKSLEKSLYTILLISASPKGVEYLRTDKEIKKIRSELRHSAPLRDRFQIEIVTAATMDDLSREVIYLKPDLVHFAGHGTIRGILLEDDDEEMEQVSLAALSALLRPLSKQVQCVILNACKSWTSAREISKYVPYVIGMRQEIFDRAAIAFSKGFYQALGAEISIENAFELGKARLMKDNFEDSLIPVLFKKKS